LKIVFISDTHGKHDDLQAVAGDMIIHAGDVTNLGSEAEAKEFLNWFKALDFTYKIFVAGNHDFYFQNLYDFELNDLIPEGVTYLNDSGINIEGLNIWGSPIQPFFFNMAFNKKRGMEIKEHWDLIPEGTDILITHGPPFNILDKTIHGMHVGCQDLLDALQLKKPKIHVFGHIHEEYGVKETHSIKFINASVLNVKYKMVNAPIEMNF